MPNEDGELSEAEGRLAAAWLDEYWPRTKRDCPISGPTNWEVQTHTVHAPVFGGGGLRIGGAAAYPYVQVICGNCGYVLLFNAVKMGLFPGEKGAGNG